MRAKYIRELSSFSVRNGGPYWVKQLDILYNREEPDRVWITKEQYKTLVSNATDPSMRMILILGGMMGLRRAEIALLMDEDIQGSTLTVRGKGHGPEGLVVRMTIPPMVLAEIETYRKYKAMSPSEDSGDGRLIQFPRYGRFAGIKPETLGQKVTECGREIGIRVTTHSLRRLYATTLCNECKCEPNDLRILLRHADISTTLKFYVQPDPTKREAAVSMFMDVMGEVVKAIKYGKVHQRNGKSEGFVISSLSTSHKECW